MHPSSQSPEISEHIPTLQAFTEAFDTLWQQAHIYASVIKGKPETSSGTVNVDLRSHLLHCTDNLQHQDTRSLNVEHIAPVSSSYTLLYRHNGQQHAFGLKTSAHPDKEILLSDPARPEQLNPATLKLSAELLVSLQTLDRQIRTALQERDERAVQELAPHVEAAITAVRAVTGNAMERVVGELKE
jgi:hypothetical protein